MTAISPDALAKSNFKQGRLADLLLTEEEFDEVFYFIPPDDERNSVVNEMNGDGTLLEVYDYARDFTWVDTSMGKIETSGDTVVYYR